MRRGNVWIGRLLASAFGLLLGGLPGLFIGIIFGYFIDQFLSKTARPADADHEISFRNTFALLAKLARADQRISKEEIDAIDWHMRESWEMDGEQRRRAIHYFHEARDSDRPFHEYAAELYQVHRDNPAILHYLIELLLDIAHADGVFHPGEEAMIHTVASIFRISDFEYEFLKQKYARPEADELEHAYALLGCRPADSDEHIKQQYRKLAKENHPDALRSQGLPPEFLEKATRKFQEIQEAYQMIKNERGFS